MADFVAKSAATDGGRPAISKAIGFDPPAGRALPPLRDTQGHERVAFAQPALRAAAGSERWPPAQTLPGHLAGHAVGADRASGCASSVRTSSRSSCRSCRYRSKPSVPANDRATSRACSWLSRGILRDGSFGQHCGLSGHASESSLLARYRRVLPSCTQYAGPKPLSARTVINVTGRVISKVAPRGNRPASTCRTQGYVARPASSASEPPRKRYPRRRSGLRPKRSSVRSIMVFAAPTSAWRIAREASTFHDDAELHVDEIVVGVRRMLAPCALRSTAPQDRMARRTFFAGQARSGTRHQAAHGSAAGFNDRVRGGVSESRGAGSLHAHRAKRT
jgi:hypothetical protein